MKLCLLLIFLTFAHNCLSIGLYDEINGEYEDWRREVGGTPDTPVETDKCKRDILILLDTSTSVRGTNYRDYVMPFLNGLVKSPKLKVGPDGTQFALVTFSEPGKTRDRFKFGERTMADYFNLFEEKLKWKHVSGQWTYTGKAAEIADTEFFPKTNPLNARENIQDIVIIITDGKPNGQPAGTQKTMAREHIGALKNRNIPIVAVGVGKNSEKEEFKRMIEEFATSKTMAFNCKFDKLEEIVDKIVNASCTTKNITKNNTKNPASCSCDGELSTEKVEYTKPGKNTIMLDWEEPELKCDQPVEDEGKTVEPSNTQNPQRFGRGERTITYTFQYKDSNGKSDKVVCPFKVKIGACECPRTQTVTAKVHFGQTKASVSWSEPVPTCPATAVRNNPLTTRGDFSVGEHNLVYKYRHSTEFQSFYIQCDVHIVVTACQCPTAKKVTKKVEIGQRRASVSWSEPVPNCPMTPSQNNPRSTTGEFIVGKHSRIYKYTYNGKPQSFSLKCRVDIVIEGVYCGGVTYNPDTHVCCSSQPHQKKNGYRCCGSKYYSQCYKICCRDTSLVSVGEYCCPDHCG